MRRAAEIALVLALVVLFFATFCLRIYSIPSISMIPTLQIGDSLLADTFEYRFRPPHDGDIALFQPPKQAEQAPNREAAPFIKRVIGVPGDTIRISDGIVYRNGHALNEPYENQPPDYNLAIKDYTIYVDDGTGVLEPLDPSQANIPPKNAWQASDRIPAGFYFLLGDNRRYSRDSHVWGFVPQARFAANAWLVFWPLGHFRLL